MRITVIVYTFDRKDYILSAVQSAANQTLDRNSYEIIAVKGFSDPQIDNEIGKFADLVITVNEKGHGKKIVAALEKSTGEIVCLLDDDDQFTREKLERIKQIFESDSEITLVHNSMDRINEDGAIISPENEAHGEETVLNTRNPDHKIISRMLARRVNWYSSCMSFRKDIFQEETGTLSKIDQSVDPMLFLMTLRVQGKIVQVGDRLTRYRVHTSTTNYSLSFEEYLSRRKEFYRNTQRNYNLVLESCEGTPAENLANLYLRHVNLMVDFTSQAPRKSIAINAIFLIRTMSGIFLARYLVWVLYAMVSLVNRQLGLRLFYFGQTSDKHFLAEMRS